MNDGCYPGLAWDLHRDRLYIAHVDDEAITVINLATRAVVRQEAIDRPVSGSAEGERISTYGRALTVGTQRYRFLTIDSSGTRLIIGGRTTTVEPVGDNRWREQDRVWAMRTLDANTFRVQGALPIDSMLIAATDFSILTQSVRFVSGGGSTAPGDFRLRLWDADDRREVWQRNTAPGDIWRTALSPDSRFVYMIRPNAAHFFREERVVPYAQGNTFGIFDFSTKQIIAERRVIGGQLIPLWHTP
jgi:hypothetical protein